MVNFLNFKKIFTKTAKIADTASVNTFKSTNNEKDFYMYYVSDLLNDVFNGDKFPGSFGATKSFSFVDYWTLRERSLQLFKENPYAIGVIRRILRNEIFTGLIPESSPIASILWPQEKAEDGEKKAVDTGKMMTEMFKLYADDKNIFDYKKQQNFGEFQETVRMESLLCGDGIIVARINPETDLPHWEWINGRHIRTPENYNSSSGNKIKHGVEIDNAGRHIAYYVRRLDGEEYTYSRISVYGANSGRRVAWMVYGSEKLVDDVRGTPILACMLYMLKEVDRYRDAESRSAVVNAMIPLIVKRAPSSVGNGSRPTANLSRLNEKTDVVAPVQGIVESQKPLSVGMEPGVIFDDLAPGEEITSFQTNRPNVNYKAFEEAIIQVFCWVLELPPEIGVLKFTSSYSASRQANSEYDIYLKYRTCKNGHSICKGIFEETIISMILNGTLDIPDFFDDFFVVKKWQLRNAWLNCSWTGLSRPSVDLLKDVKAARDAIDLGISTYDDQSRKLFGKSFRTVQMKLKSERDMMKEMGFISAADENALGEPVQESVAGSEEDDEKENEEEDKEDKE